MTDGAHDHPLIGGDIVTAVAAEHDRAMAAEKALSDRIAKLEGATPPPTGSPTWWVPPAITKPDVQIPPSLATEADMRASFQAFLKQVPFGSTIIGGGPSVTYRHNGSLWLGIMAGRHDLVLDFKGAKLENTSPAMAADANSSSNKASSFYWHYTEKPFPTHITIRNAVIHAANPSPGRLIGSEFAAAAHFMGGTYFEVDNVISSGTFGDLVTINENAQFVYVHGSKTVDVGRNNVSVVCGSHVAVWDCAFGIAGYCVLDIEPETGSIANIDDFSWLRNTDKGYAPAAQKGDIWFALDGADSGKKVTNVLVDANTSTGPLTMLLGGPTGKARPNGVQVTNNAGAAGGYIKGQHIDGWVSRKNTAGGVLIVPALTDCPNPALT